MGILFTLQSIGSVTVGHIWQHLARCGLACVLGVGHTPCLYPVPFMIVVVKKLPAVKVHTDGAQTVYPVQYFTCWTDVRRHEVQHLQGLRVVIRQRGHERTRRTRAPDYY